MEEDKIITLESYYDPMLAQIIKGRLEANEIPCFLADELTISVNPLYNQALGGVKIKIFARDEERCRKLLAEDIDLPDTAVKTDDTCPFCNSHNISYVPSAKKRSNWVVMLISLLMAIYPFYQKKSWHCFDCGEDFSKKD